MLEELRLLLEAWLRLEFLEIYVGVVLTMLSEVVTDENMRRKETAEKLSACLLQTDTVKLAWTLA